MSTRKSKFTEVLSAAKQRGDGDPPLPKAVRGTQRGGKQHDPDYKQTTAYIPKELHKLVKQRLIDDDGHDYSELVEHLLTQWCGKGNRKLAT